MLWADDNIHLPDNFYASLVQFKSLEKRLEKDLNLKTQYASDIRSDVEKGYVVPVSPHDSKNRSDREWYVPHHPVLNPNKPGKVRRVLNGAFRFHGKSLNNSLLVGSFPLFQNFYKSLLFPTFYHIFDLLNTIYQNISQARTEVLWIKIYYNEFFLHKNLST